LADGKDQNRENSAHHETSEEAKKMVEPEKRAGTKIRKKLK
jgi:hypothetical protein